MNKKLVSILILLSGILIASGYFIIQSDVFNQDKKLTQKDVEGIIEDIKKDIEENPDAGHPDYDDPNIGNTDYDQNLVDETKMIAGASVSSDYNKDDSLYFTFWSEGGLYVAEPESLLVYGRRNWRDVWSYKIRRVIKSCTPIEGWNIEILEAEYNSCEEGFSAPDAAEYTRQDIIESASSGGLSMTQDGRYIYFAINFGGAIGETSGFIYDRQEDILGGGPGGDFSDVNFFFDIQDYDHDQERDYIKGQHYMYLLGRPEYWGSYLEPNENKLFKIETIDGEIILNEENMEEFFVSRNKRN